MLLRGRESPVVVDLDGGHRGGDGAVQKLFGTGFHKMGMKAALRTAWRRWAAWVRVCHHGRFVPGEDVADALHGLGRPFRVDDVAERNPRALPWADMGHSVGAGIDVSLTE